MLTVAAKRASAIVARLSVEPAFRDPVILRGLGLIAATEESEGAHP